MKRFTHAAPPRRQSVGAAHGGHFLRYRPVLDNLRLKEVFGYVPRLTSAEVFELFRKSHGLGPA